MLKTKRGRKVWLITQPAHAELAGEMAAHWGNEEFAAPGHFAKSADPPVSAADGLPQGLGEVLKNPAAGMERWRMGIPRLAEQHPYASLLIGDHAYRLYAMQCDPNPPPEFTHHLQFGQKLYPKGLETEARRFMADVQEMQAEYQRRLEEDGFWRAALEPDQRNPHARLLQTLDALSLALCSATIAPVKGVPKGLGEDHVVFYEVPRRSWKDRLSLEIKPLAEGQIVIDPYPFDETPLMVTVPARVAEPHTWWCKEPRRLKRFTFLRR